MKEFGSDFHTIKNNYNSENLGFTSIFHNVSYLANGRQGLILILRQEKYKRLWVPEYYCYDILKDITKATNIKFEYYKCYPGIENLDFLMQLPFEKGDALLIMNYYGLDNNINFPEFVPVIEDHSHDLLNSTAFNSNADWCFASLRKTLPLAEGGIVWSPKGYKADDSINTSIDNEQLATRRWLAMDMKADYLNTSNSIEQDIKLKESFRKLYLETEEAFSCLEISSLDDRSIELLKHFDVKDWYNQKKKNWIQLTSLIANKIDYLIPKNDSCTPFSLVLKLDNLERREKFRKELIKNGVYPAVLWSVPETCSKEVRMISDSLLSIHCDGRYTEQDITKLACIINIVYNSL